MTDDRPLPSLKRRDTPEDRAYWDSVEKAAQDWERQKPDWLRKQENKDQKGSSSSC